MSRLANHYRDIPSEVLEAAFATALRTPDPDELRVEAARSRLRAGGVDAGMVAECMLRSLGLSAVQS